MINKTVNLTFNCKGVQETYEAKYPNVGQYIDIENKKIQLSNGNYYQMASSGIATMNKALDYIDSYAYFSVLIPQFIKDLNVNSFFELSTDDADEIVKVFKEDFITWFNDINQEINNVNDEKKENEEANE